MKFKLIVALVEPEITSDVIATAKKSGATGNVVMTARGTGIEEVRFFGVSLADKTDVILFVVEEHSVKNIMESVSNENKLHEPGRGILIALSIDKVAGLDRQIMKIKDKLKSEQLYL
jgi:nitrogen regulatory protein P-II 1